MDGIGLNYDALRALNDPNQSQSIPKPKLFSLTQSMNQLENLNVSQGFSHGRLPFSGNPHVSRSLRPLGGEQNTRRPPIFPALQRFQKQQNQNHDQQPKAPAKAQLFTLLKPTTPAPLFAESQNIVHIQPDTNRSSSPILKHEEHSDKDFSSSSPRHSRSLSAAHISVYHDPPQSQQMLPPPPPTGPVSRPESRARSRSRSSASFRLDERPVGSDSSPLGTTSSSIDLPDIAINALRQVQIANADLAEERRQNQALLSQLQTLTSTHDALKQTHDSVQRELVSGSRRFEEQAQELTSARENHTLHQTNLSTLQEELRAAQAALKAEREDKKRMIERAKQGMTSMNEDYTNLYSSLEKLKTSYEASQSLVGDLRNARALAAEGLRTLEPLLDGGGRYARAVEVKTLVTELQAELVDSRGVNDYLRDKLSGISSQLANAQGRIRELEDSERGKLLMLVGTLTGEERGNGEAAKRSDLVEKMNVLMERLMKKEHESIGILAEAAGFEARLEVANTDLEKKVGEMKAVNDAKDKVMEELAHSISTVHELEARIKTLETKLQERAVKTEELYQHKTCIEQSLTMANEELALARGANHAHEKHVLMLKNEVKVLQTQLADVRQAHVIALEEAKQARISTAEKRERCTVLEKELNDLQVGNERLQTQLTDIRQTQTAVMKETVQLRMSSAKIEKQTEALQADNEHLRTQLSDAHQACATTVEEVKQMRGVVGEQKTKILYLEEIEAVGKGRVETMRQTEIRIAILQERFDAQAITLRLTKEQCGDLQERLTASENELAMNMNRHASATGKLQGDIAVLKGQNATMQVALDAVRQELARHRVSFSDVSADFEKKFAKQEATSERLMEEVAKRADAAEREVSDYRTVVKQLRERVLELDEERTSIGVRMEDVEAERVTVLKEMVAELQQTNRALVARASSLRARYAANDLTDDEKDFVDWLIAFSNSLYEQEEVKKENELRRRENMICTLNTRIRELESSLARLLKEKDKEAGGEAKSMIDLNQFMTSSPMGSDPPVASKGQAPIALEALTLPREVNMLVSSPIPLIVAPVLPALTPISIKIPARLTPTKAKPKAQPQQQTKPAVKKLHAQAPTSLPAPVLAGSSEDLKVFSRLAADSDSEDDTPLSEMSIASVLGKRERVPSPPAPALEPAKVVKRRLRAAAPVPPAHAQAALAVQKKTADTTTKPKKKRR